MHNDNYILPSIVLYALLFLYLSFFPSLLLSSLSLSLSLSLSGKRSIAQLRRSLYKLKDIESPSSSNDESYHQILREIVGNDHQLMSDVKEPKLVL